MNKNFSLRKLNNSFYSDYPHSCYSEFLYKDDRPFVVLLITIKDNRFAIPLRTNIPHNSGYKFKNSKRETKKGSGLDFTKAVIVNGNKYLGEEVTIDNTEYIELDKNFYEIKKKFNNYLNNYIKFVKNPKEDFRAREYQYTTLKYYHKELHLK